MDRGEVEILPSALKLSEQLWPTPLASQPVRELDKHLKSLCKIIT